MKITVQHNFPAIQRQLNAMAGDVQTKALASAMNKTVEQARTQMVREITKEYSVTAGYVRDRLRIRRASFKAGRFGVEAALLGGDGKRRSANIIRFMEKSVTLAEARRRRKGGTLSQLRFKIKKAGGKQVITGAFIGNKGRTVFIRTGKGRLPIKAVSTIDVPQMFNQRRINAAVVQAIKDKFPAVFQREAAFFLARSRAA